MYLYYMVGLADVLTDLSLESFANDLLHSRYFDIYPIHILRDMKVKSKFRCPSTENNEMVKLLEQYAQKFHDAALEVTGLVDDINAHSSVKVMFYRDYAEQVSSLLPNFEFMKQSLTSLQNLFPGDKVGCWAGACSSIFKVLFKISAIKGRWEKQ